MPPRMVGMPSDDEEPLPAVQAALAFEFEQEAGEWGADDAGERGGGHELGDGAGPFFGREPIGEIEDHAGEEAGLGDAEEETQGVEGVRAFDQTHAGGDDAPGDHDAGDPKAGADLAKEEIAGQIEEALAKKEDAGARAVDGGRQHEVAAHLQRGEAYVDAVQVGKDVEHEDVWDQAPADLAVERACVYGRFCRGRVTHSFTLDAALNDL